MLVIGY
jgi:hypothetical protein